MRRTIFATLMLGIGMAGGCMVGSDMGAVSIVPDDVPVDGDDAEPGDTEEAEPTGVVAVTISEGLDAEERVLLTKLNAYRASLGVAPLQASVALSRAADVHAVDMANKNYFSHDSQDGTSWSTRVRQYYNYNTYLAENIAAGNAGGDPTFTQWKNSAGHDANMKSANYRVIGIGRAYASTSTYKWYWVTDFGGYVDEVMTPDGTTTPPPPPPPSNLLANGGFEADDLGAGLFYTSVSTAGRWHWGSQYATGNASLVAGAAAAGAKGARVVDALTGNISLAQIVAATAGKTYTFSAKTRRVSGANGQVVYIDFLNASKVRIGRGTISAGSDTAFHTITRSYTAPTGTAFIRVVIYGYIGNNDYASTYDWDDVTLATN